MTKILSLNGQPNTQSVKATIGTLYNYHLDIEGGKHTVWNILLRKQIQDFQNKNGLKIRNILEQVHSVQKEYLQFEGEKVKMENNKPVLIEGKSEEDLNQKWDALMQTEINILI